MTIVANSGAGQAAKVFNVYCDESCHLEFDHQPCMVLGAVWCRENRVRAVADELRAIKARHGLSRSYELKWTKVSAGKEAYYREVVDYFVESPDLRFRCLVAVQKERLNHESWSRGHDDWYYVMYYDMLKVLGGRDRELRVYLDIKDTLGHQKVVGLGRYLAHVVEPIGGSIGRIQTIRSHESELLQVADLLIGAVSYANRGLAGMAAKSGIVARLEDAFGRRLTTATPLSWTKFNIFIWTPQ